MSIRSFSNKVSINTNTEYSWGGMPEPARKPTVRSFKNHGDQTRPEYNFTVPLSKVGRFTAQLVPGMKYMVLDNEREKFARMDHNQKEIALTMAAMEMFGIMAAPAIFTGIKGLFGLGARGIKSALIRPLPQLSEEIASLATKGHAEAVASTLAKLGVTEAENIGISSFLRGDSTALKKVALQQAKTGTSEPWKKFISYGGDFASETGGLGIKPELANILTPDAILREAVKRGWSSTLNMKAVLGDYTATAKVEEKIFQNHMKRYYGDLAKTKTLKNGTNREIAAASADMLRSPAIAQKTISPEGFVNFKPVYILLGQGDELFGTWKHLRKAETATGNTNKETLKYTMLLQSMADDRGLGTLEFVTKGGKQVSKYTANTNVLTATGRDVTKATMESIDGMLGKLHKIHPNDPMRKEITRRTYAEVQALKDQMDEGSKGLLEVSYSFLDRLYADHMKLELRSIINRTPLSRQGIVTADRMLAGMESQIENVFGTTSKYTYTGKITEINNMLGSLKDNLVPHIVGSKKEMFKLKNAFKLELTMGGDGQWMSYLDHYTPRLYESAQRTTGEILDMLSGELKPFYMKPRTLGEGALPQVDWETMMASRIRAHTKRFHLYPTMTEIAQEAQLLPGNFKELYAHWFSRLLNIPSDIDHTIAKVMTRTVGSMERVLGKSGVWDGYRVSRLASTINDGVYAGVLGFNPFPAGRNSLQPFLNVPADFGGVSNYPKLLRQYAKLGDKRTWSRLNGIGVFTDYAPELTQKSALLGLGRKLGPFTVPRSDKFRDMGMWAFHGVDKVNRFVTGSMALDDFALAAKKVPQIMEGKGVDTFMRAAGTKHTQPWIQREVEYFLRNKNFAMAEEVFTKAKVGDSQYLYGSLYSPIVSQTYGAFGKTGVVFHSWWMNYGQLLKKWMTTGDVDAVTSRLFAWMTSSAMMYTAMEPIWGDHKAMNAVLFGPFPGFQTVKSLVEDGSRKIPDANLDLIGGISPVWRVPVEGARAFARMGSLLLGGDDNPGEQRAREKMAMAQFKSFNKSWLKITVPGFVIGDKILSEIDKGPAAVGKAFIGVPSFR